MSTTSIHFKTVFWVLVLIFIQGPSFAQATYYAVATGDWNDANTWAATSGGTPGAGPPTSIDNAILDNTIPSVVTVTANTTIYDVSVYQPTNNGNNDLVINSGVTFQVTNELHVSGDEQNGPKDSWVIVNIRGDFRR